MTTVLDPPIVEPPIPLSRILRFTAAEYNRLTEIGFFTPSHRVELLEGLQVTKMAHNELHATVLDLLEELLAKMLTTPWTFRTQRPVVLSGDNMPEPDLVVVPSPKRRYFRAHPSANEIALVVEVSGTTLEQDRGLKQRIYARNRLPAYWIVNLLESCIEVYTQPRAGKTASYRRIKVYGRDEVVPVDLRGDIIGGISVNDLLP